MSQRSLLVVRLGVRCELGAPLGTCPLLGCIHERTPDASKPDRGVDEPAFEEPDAVGRARLRVRPNRDFGETDEAAAARLGYENRERVRRCPAKEAIDIDGVIAFGALGP